MWFRIGKVHFKLNFMHLGKCFKIITWFTVVPTSYNLLCLKKKIYISHSLDQSDNDEPCYDVPIELSCVGSKQLPDPKNVFLDNGLLKHNVYSVIVLSNILLY